MVEKRLCPFNSPHARVWLCAITVVSAGSFIYSVVAVDLNGMVAASSGLLIVSWLAWTFHTGVQVRPGQSVGGGPVYPTCALQRDETILFDAPGGLWSGRGHLFVTNQRLIVLPVRFYGKVQTLGIDEVADLTASKAGIGWPLPRQSLTLIARDRSLKLRPWGSAWIIPSSFLGVISGDAFVSGVLDALHRAGCAASLPTSDF
jgi:hypothetical protein